MKNEFGGRAGRGRWRRQYIRLQANIGDDPIDLKLCQLWIGHFAAFADPSMRRGEEFAQIGLRQFVTTP